MNRAEARGAVGQSAAPFADTPPETASRNVLLSPQGAVLLALAAGVTFFVFKDAWVSDDALITFRYVQSLLHGHGAVFNVGERVQGYTHPLWFLLLSAVTAITGDEFYAAVLLGLVLTFAACLTLGLGLISAGGDRTGGLAAAALALSVLATSDSWRSFQTSGLELSLTTLLLVGFVLALAARPWRPGTVLALGSLLVLSHPDMALIAGPACLLALVELARARRWGVVAAAVAPLLLWAIFARAYYGDFLPNTSAAKLGIFSFDQGVSQGWRYLKDWAVNEPFTVAAGLALLVFGAVCARRMAEWLLLAGLVAYFLYVLVIGGDFMRGRFFEPLLVASVCFGALALARRLALQGEALVLAGAVLGVAAIALLVPKLGPGQHRAQTIPASGIVNERLFYWPGYSLKSYRAHGHMINRAIGQDQVDKLARYVAKCGPTTIHSLNPSFLAFYVGPRLSLIDLHGLTDRYIARLPNDQLEQRPPRPGHPVWRVPVSYLAGRGDIGLLPDLQTGLDSLDCGMQQRALAMKDSKALYSP